MPLTRIIQFDHGINTPRRSGATVPERFEAFMAAQAACKATVLTDQYNAGPFPRLNMALGKNQRLAEARAKIIVNWTGAHHHAELVLIGHSNGCDIARRTAILLDDLSLQVRRLILIAPPLPRTVQKCGLMPLVRRGTQIVNWVMEADEVLPPARKPIRAALSWPYGNAGKYGFDDADGEIWRFSPPAYPWPIYNRRFPWRHSEAFSAQNEPETFIALLEEAMA